MPDPIKSFTDITKYSFNSFTIVDSFTEHMVCMEQMKSSWVTKDKTWSEWLRYGLLEHSYKDVYQSPLILTELFQHNLINVSYLTACYLYQVMMTLHFLNDVANDA